MGGRSREHEVWPCFTNLILQKKTALETKVRHIFFLIKMNKNYIIANFTSTQYRSIIDIITYMVKFFLN